jgi:butyrate kinase
MERILVINPGSTSTKLAVFDDDKRIMAVTVRHPLEEVKHFKWVMDQFDYRMELINKALEENGIAKETLTCVMARGGLLPPVPSGAFTVNQAMIDYFYAAKVDTHISNLACVLADAIARPLGIPAMVYDPVAVDELDEISRITGMPEIPKKSRGHVLNSRAMARKCAEERLHKTLEDCTIIVLHIGGGCSAWLSHKGRLIDCYSDDDAGFAPERCGRLQAMDLAMLCYSGKYTKEEMSRYIRGNSGLKAYLGTSDGMEIERMIESGDEKAKLLYDAMALSHAKGIAELAAAVNGKVDRIVITGGLAHSKLFTEMLTKRIEWIAPVEIMAGEFEMEALAAGGLRVLRGEEKAHEFSLEK